MNWIPIAINFFRELHFPWKNNLQLHSKTFWSEMNDNFNYYHSLAIARIENNAFE